MAWCHKAGVTAPRGHLTQLLTASWGGGGSQGKPPRGCFLGWEWKASQRMLSRWGWKASQRMLSRWGWKAPQRMLSRWEMEGQQEWPEKKARVGGAGGDMTVGGWHMKTHKSKNIQFLYLRRPWRAAFVLSDVQHTLFQTSPVQTLKKTHACHLKAFNRIEFHLWCSAERIPSKFSGMLALVVQSLSHVWFFATPWTAAR